MVAAWIRADAGVGPSMASGSQSWKGTSPDLPATPMITPTRPMVSASSWPGAVRTATRSVLRARTASATSPTTIAMSATRVTRNALYAARRASGRSLSCPMSSHEHQPMTSQPTSTSTRSEACTSRSMPPAKSETVAVNWPYRGSSRRYHAVKTWMQSTTTATTSATRPASWSESRCSGTCSEPVESGPRVSMSAVGAGATHWMNASTATQPDTPMAMPPASSRRRLASRPARAATAGRTTIIRTIQVTCAPPRRARQPRPAQRPRRARGHRSTRRTSRRPPPPRRHRRAHRRRRARGRP